MVIAFPDCLLGLGPVELNILFTAWSHQIPSITLLREYFYFYYDHCQHWEQHLTKRRDSAHNCSVLNEFLSLLSQRGEVACLRSHRKSRFQSRESDSRACSLNEFNAISSCWETRWEAGNLSKLNPKLPARTWIWGSALPFIWTNPLTLNIRPCWPVPSCLHYRVWFWVESCPPKFRVFFFFFSFFAL